ncbi:MAG: hypothetical protein ACM3OB_07415 [Acidobacteriota bacterium]
MRRPWLLLSFILLAPAPAAALQPVGPELQVAVLDDSTADPRPSAAIADDGSAAIVWTDRAHGLRARFLDPDGAPASDILDLVPNLPLPTFPGEGTVKTRKDPVATYERDGSLLVAWTEETGYEVATYFEDRYTVLERDVMARRFTTDGRPVGPAFRVNPIASGYQSRPSLGRLRCAAANPRACDGTLVVVWQGEDQLDGPTAGDGLFGRLFDPYDRPLTGQLRIAPQGQASNAVVASDDAGAFLVLWDDFGDGNGRAVFARRFNSQGRALTKPAILNRKTAGHQMRPALAFAGSGYLAVWQSPTGRGPDHRVYGVLLDRQGRTRSGELLLTQGRAQWELLPTLASTGAGYVLLWTDWNSGLPDAVVGVPLTGSAQRIASEQPISSGRLARQYGIRAISGPSGQVLVVWEGMVGNDTTIMARRLASGGP